MVHSVELVTSLAPARQPHCQPRDHWGTASSKGTDHWGKASAAPLAWIPAPVLVAVQHGMCHALHLPKVRVSCTDAPITIMTPSCIGQSAWLLPCCMTLHLHLAPAPGPECSKTSDAAMAARSCYDCVMRV
jgi:hypothetical protein